MAPRRIGGLSWGVLNDPVKAGYLGETRWALGDANPENPHDPSRPFLSEFLPGFR